MTQPASPKILLAEDDNDMRRFLVKALENAGYEVIDYDNGMSAYRRLREEPFELLLTDIVMPEMDGIELARRAAELTRPENGGLEPTKAAGRALTDRPGAAQFVAEVGVAGGEAEQAEFALALQRALVRAGLDGGPARAGTLLSALMQRLYNLDVFEEDGIRTWWADPRAVEGGDMETARERCRALVEWLENADEEDEDDDEEEDEDDDDDDD